MNKGQFGLLDELAAKDFVEHSPLPDQPPGIKGLKAGLKLFKKGFPDLKFKVEDMIAEGDKVAARITYGGTHKGKFMGIKPTGKKFKIMGTDFVRFGKDGKVKEHWSGDDAYLKMMQQLGLIPEM